MSRELSKAELWREWQAAEAENKRLREALDMVQWVCGQPMLPCPQRHSPDCPWSRALEGGEG